MPATNFYRDDREYSDIYFLIFDFLFKTSFKAENTYILLIFKIKKFTIVKIQQKQA